MFVNSCLRNERYFYLMDILLYLPELLMVYGAFNCLGDELKNETFVTVFQIKLDSIS